ncbi:adhesin biosynthesis transcription regulatory family protein [Escherichia coli]|uniref:adhesin biosynthesis transcription regulatory family protein n=1 Tax=Escherichia coli TaxID=562 RepID=UPI0021CEEC36|nr:adhesin biosynthesis transcription regulatory family protein [Escherichia coli]MCU6345215.1 adhesin biosynthesis transcription regulatory family protein [Escherichia coli]
MTEKADEFTLARARKNLTNRARQGWLISGYVSEEQFWLLVGASSMHSDKVIKALFDYLVNGAARKNACAEHGVNSGHFSIGLNRLQHFSHTAAKLAVFYQGC